MPNESPVFFAQKVDTLFNNGSCLAPRSTRSRISGPSFCRSPGKPFLERHPAYRVGTAVEFTTQFGQIGNSGS